MLLSKKNILVLTTLIMILALTAGCGRAAVSDSNTSGSNSSGSSNSSTSDSDTSGSSSSISADGVDYQIGEDLKLPRKFPAKAAPMYKENGIFMTMGDDDSETWSVGYHSKGKIEDVINYYKENFKNAENKSEVASEDGGFFYYEKDGYEIVIIVSEQSDKEGLADVVLTLTPIGG